MTAFLIIIALAGSRSLSPSPWDLLETGGMVFWTSGSVMGEQRFLFNGEPVILYGNPCFPPWSSSSEVELLNPLEGGVWSTGCWTLDFTSSELPDDCYESGIGLLENTAGRNRYSIYLRRPLPGSLGFDFSAGREDTLNSQRMVLKRDPFDAGIQMRQGDGSRYILWSGWNGTVMRARAGFARMYDGCRQFEGLGSTSFESGCFVLETGAGGSYLKDSLWQGELHLLSRISSGRFLFTGRGDITDTDGDLNLGGSAGCSAELGLICISAGGFAAPGNDLSLILAADAGPFTATLIREKSRTLAGGDIAFSLRNLLVMGSVTGFDTDSLRLAGSILPSIRYWNARISAGIRCDLMLKEQKEWYGTIDLLSAFTLGRFAFVLAVEDIDSDTGRNWTFGLSWEFTDRPPEPEEEEEEGRGS